MNTKISDQKKLMQKAIDTLDSMDEIFRIYGKFDHDYVKRETDIRGTEYAEIMSALLGSLLDSAGINQNDIFIRTGDKLSEVA